MSTKSTFFFLFHTISKTPPPSASEIPPFLLRIQRRGYIFNTILRPLREIEGKILTIQLFDKQGLRSNTYLSIHSVCNLIPASCPKVKKSYKITSFLPPCLPKEIHQKVCILNQIMQNIVSLLIYLKYTSIGKKKLCQFKKLFLTCITFSFDIYHY